LQALGDDGEPIALLQGGVIFGPGCVAEKRLPPPIVDFSFSQVVRLRFF
jgi:hypothetical protein